MTEVRRSPDESPAGAPLHVLMCAGACHPDLGSEFAVGWQWATAAARHNRVTLIIGDAHGAAEAIRARLEEDANLRKNLRVCPLPWFDPPRSRTLERLWKAVPTIYYWHYRHWLELAAAEMQRVLEEESVDLVHQVTYICYREPGKAFALGLPYVWGPIGGTQDVPWRFLPSLGPYDGFRHAARNVLNWIHLHCRRDVARAMRSAAGLSAVASDTQSAIRHIFGRHSVVIPATACSEWELPPRSSRERDSLHLVFSGLHIARKGLPFALRALGRLRDLPWTLDVLGNGPLTASWQRLSDRLGIAERVCFHGVLPRKDAIRLMAGADALVFPSLQEGWPTVVIEALGLGLPVVTTRQHGMADMIDESCGVVLPLTTPKKLVADLTEALRTLILDRDRVRLLSAGALSRAEQLGRDNQVQAIEALYRNALAAHEARR